MRYQKKSHAVSKIEPSVISLFFTGVGIIFLIKIDKDGIDNEEKQ
jgi:hypothetical protein